MKFIVWFQVGVKISMILPRKQMPIGTLTKKPHHYGDSQSWNKICPRSLVSQNFSRENSEQLPLRFFQLWLLWMLWTKQPLSRNVGTKGFPLCTRMLPAHHSGLLSKSPWTRGQMQGNEHCVLQTQEPNGPISQGGRVPDGHLQGKKTNQNWVSGLQLRLCSLLNVTALHR